MFASAYRRSAPALALVASLAGCGGPQALPGGMVPQAVGPASQQNAVKSFQPGQHPTHDKSWMMADPMATNLVYITDTFAKVVDVYTYPGLKSAGQLTGFSYPQGECTDKTGDVYIADAAGTVYEYAHGGTSPINTITTWMYQPTGCAINPKTGDLAVANGNVQVIVFPNGGAGSPVAYRDFNFQQTISLGYDSHGNLFVDGYDGSHMFHYAELPKGAEAFTDITLNGFPTSNGAGGVQWDGTYMTVGDSESTIYRTEGSNVVGATLLLGTQCVFAYYITPSKHDVIAPDQCGTNLVGVYPYPGDGNPLKAITSGLETPYGAVLSI
ncbi:MAG: hypothetical protein JO113_06650 [Candidatus Eremiobacteraeota bacterium]|nr:hypothetical protein [Candidatus Eremiobacteraeota bacterium]